MITEIAALGGASTLGFIFKFITNMQQDSHKQKMAMLNAVEASREAASARGGVWVRRFIVIVLLGILGIIATGFGNMPTNIVADQTPVSILWGLIEVPLDLQVTEITGGMYDETIRLSILSIIGYYFGTSAAER